MGDSRTKLKRLANVEAARARRLASNPRLRLVCLADLPPLETDKSGGEWLTMLQQAMADTLKDQGRHIKPDNINPFEAEPCAVAVLIGTVAELEELRARVNNNAGAVAELRVVEQAVEKIVGQELPNLHGKCDGLGERVTELEERIPAPDPLVGDAGVVETLRATVTELEERLETLEQRLGLGG